MNFQITSVPTRLSQIVLSFVSPVLRYTPKYCAIYSSMQVIIIKISVQKVKDEGGGEGLPRKLFPATAKTV